MKIITDPDVVHSVLNRYSIYSFFQTKDLPFFIAWIEKDEDISQKLDPADYIIFFLQGQISIHIMRPDGTRLSLSRVRSFCMLGDMRFVEPDGYNYEIQVEKRSLVAAVDLSQCRNQLMQDPVFLFQVARSIRQKLIKARIQSEASGDFREKLLYYMQKRKDHRITNVGEACEDLHCSRRQMQRLLHDLCEEGIIERTAKGKYILAKDNTAL